MAAYRPATVNIDVSGSLLSVAGIEATASTFDVLRTPAMLGRVLQPDDEQPGAPRVVVIGHDLWRAQFTGDPAILGRPIRIGGALFTIVGVMPAGFRFPATQQLWMPLHLSGEARRPRAGDPLVVFGRLADGVAPAAAQAELQTLTGLLAVDDARTFERLRPTILPAWHLTFGFPTPGGLRALQPERLPRPGRDLLGDENE